jgi:hypothetical protein
MGFDDVSPYPSPQGVSHNDRFAYNDDFESAQTYLAGPNAPTLDDSTSRHTAHDDISLYHSTQDVSHNNNSYMYNEDLQGHQAFATSPAPRVDPWSQYNRRVRTTCVELRQANKDQFGSSPHASYPSAVNVFNQPSPPPYPTRAFETSYASQESGLRFDSPDALHPRAHILRHGLQPPAQPPLQSYIPTDMAMTT